MILPLLLLSCLLAPALKAQQPPAQQPPAPPSQRAPGPSVPLVSPSQKNYIPVITDTPQDTVRTFMEAMNDYKLGVEKEDRARQTRLEDAIRTLQISEQKNIFQNQSGSEEAILLKEIIDRLVLLDYRSIPATSELERWRIPHTEIIIQKETEGERIGQYLFSAGTLAQLSDIYARVEKLPYLAELEESTRGAAYREQERWLKNIVPTSMQSTLFSLHWWQWVGILAVVLVGLALMLCLRLAIGLLRSILRRTGSVWIEMFLKSIQRPLVYIAGIGFWFACLTFLRIQGVVFDFLVIVLHLLLSAALIWLAHRSTDVLSDYLGRLALRTKSNLDDLLLPLLSRSLKIFVIAIGALLAIQNLGINIFSLVAGLGLGGVALAFAARDTIANLFGSFMIAFDRPFQIGDWIKIGNHEGTVETIGFRSTRVRTFYNSLVSIPNSEVAAQEIDNMGARRYRRVVSRLSVTYDTPAEKLHAFIEGIKKIIAEHPSTRKDYYHVVFNEYGDSGLIILVYFFLEVPNWSAELIEKQNVFTLILRLAANVGVSFAFPTRTLHLEGLEGLPNSGNSGGALAAND